VPEPPALVTIDGAVRTAHDLSIERVRSLPRRSLVVTLECAGNGRAFIDPPAPGEQWKTGAVSTAEWTGVALRSVLDLAGPLPSAVEALFTGADEGTPKDLGRTIPFERSLPIADALGGEALIAFEMNGEPLPLEHGAPLRLVVPGWYGMASVKWLRRITLVEQPFRGFYQTDRYVIDGRPLREIAPRAVITSPREGDRVPVGPVELRGYAWSGGDEIAAVERELDGGATWTRVQPANAPSRYAWREWSLRIDAKRGDLVIVARAVTKSGATQPLDPVWNALGYSNNGARPVRLTVT
jgi:DMSO/TMAO reductase YedYZ molybdopterin-dependent catalytic subunit